MILATVCAAILCFLISFGSWRLAERLGRTPVHWEWTVFLMWMTGSLVLQGVLFLLLGFGILIKGVLEVLI